MSRTDQELYDTALEALLNRNVAGVALSRDWVLLREVARLAHQDAPHAMAFTDRDLFRKWRDAVTSFHLGGWGNMTPERVDEVAARQRARHAGEASGGPSR